MYQEGFQQLDQQTATHTTWAALSAPIPPGDPTYHKTLPAFGPTQHQPSDLPSFGPNLPNDFNSSQYENQPWQPYHSSSNNSLFHAPLPAPLPSPSYLPAPGSSSAGNVLQGPFRHFSYSGPSTAGTSKVISALEDESEKVAREMQIMFDAENASGVIPSMWPSTSFFKSDEEYAMSLADDCDEQSRNTIAHPKTTPASPSATSSVDTDEEYARRMQAELDASGLRQKGTGSQNTVNSEEEQTVEIDLETDEVLLHDFGEQNLAQECANCKKRLLNSDKDVIQLTKKWIDKYGKLSASSPADFVRNLAHAISSGGGSLLTLFTIWRDRRET